MSVGIVLYSAQDISLVHWAQDLARARHTGLVVFWAVHRRGTVPRESTRDGSAVPDALSTISEQLQGDQFRLSLDSPTSDELPADDGEQWLPLEFVSLQFSAIEKAIEREVKHLGIDSLTLPRDADMRSKSPEFAPLRYLLSALCCEVIVLTPGPSAVRSHQSILAPIGEGPHSVTCVRLAKELAASSDATVTAVNVTREVNDLAEVVGERIISRMVTQAVGKHGEEISKKVVVADNVTQGVLDEIRVGGHDLVVLGMQRAGLVRRWSGQGLGERLVQARPEAAIAVVQSALPLTNRLLHRCDQIVRANVPQLPREQRIKLFERIQSSSAWDFDFIALISLSTLIAAGGLIQNSAAVVIGAMLVAPLMTPLLGTGLSLVQGNWVLFCTTLQTVLRGFLLAFVLGLIVGLVVPVHVGPELDARGWPGVLDLFVAFVSGIAAAYATGRPNLLSALPGVAIAASLIPPIATSGLAVGTAELLLARGAALLFFTNIVAIILGTAVSFWAVGIRSSHQHGSFNRWTLSAGTLLVLIILGLAVIEALPPRSLTPELQAAIQLAADKGEATVERIQWRRIDGAHAVEVRLQAPRPIASIVLERIEQDLRRALPRAKAVRIRTEIVNDYRRDGTARTRPPRGLEERDASALQAP